VNVSARRERPEAGQGQARLSELSGDKADARLMKALGVEAKLAAIGFEPSTTWNRLFYKRAASIQIVAHPSRHTPVPRSATAGKAYFRHAVCVIRDDSIEVLTVAKPGARERIERPFVPYRFRLSERFLKRLASGRLWKKSD
jgi:hypothetical protein